MSERRNILTDPQSSRVKRVAGLFRRSSRNRHGRYLAEGPQAVREAIKYVPEQVLDLYLTEAAGKRHQDILQSAQQANIYLHWVSQAVMEAISTDAQGLVAVMDLAGIRAGADALAQVLKGATQVVVMSETQDPGNAGTIIRVADAAGADAVIMARGCVELTSPKVIRASAGSLYHLPVITGLALDDIISALRDAQLNILAADGAAHLSLFAIEDMLTTPVAWLLGNEARGLSRSELNHADAVVAIPIYGKAESLNVATAAAVCLYATARAQH